MGILAPLFLAGLVGLSLPILFHLVRRTPRGRQEFSSLMFLAPTPPRLTRRSRLDQILLLLLRLAVLVLLAFAFARPFLRESSLLSLSDLPRRRVAILVDTSASMRRGDLWPQAVVAVENQLDELAPHDDVALFAFADRLETMVGFPTDKSPATVAARDVVRQRLKQLKPTWGAGDLGAALTTLAGELDAASDVQQSLAEPQLVVISDFQQGNRIEALQGFEWPDRVRVVAKNLTSAQTSNATLQLLASEEGSPADEPRVRVVSTADSKRDQFYLRWHDARKPESTSGETAVYVPPGQSRVVRLPRPESNLLSDRILLRGDDYDYDNTFFVVPPRQQIVSLAYFGDDKEDDAQGWQYYLKLATSGDPLRKVELQVLSGDEARLNSLAEPPQLVVATRLLAAAQQVELQAFVERGGTLILGPRDEAAAASLPSFFGDLEVVPSVKERPSDEFHLLGEIDFTHPLFVQFANPRYNDFTRIHFWQHRVVNLKPESKARVLARFDNFEPWLIERISGKGRIYGLTSTWQPDDSQLAVSSKFVPLVGNLLDEACGTTDSNVSTVVNASVVLPRNHPALEVRTPQGQRVAVKAEAADFRETSEPGVYQAGAGKDEFRFAVNVSPSESDTTPLPLEKLEQLGVRLGAEVTQAEKLEKLRQERDTELESRQQIWRWLLVCCLAVAIVETWWAGRASRAAAMNTEAAA